MAVNGSVEWQCRIAVSPWASPALRGQAAFVGPRLL
jgi:hypothetical protein